MLRISANSSFIFDFLNLQFQFLSEIYFPPDLLFEHHIHQQKTMLSHHLSNWDYLHILDTTPILVIHKSVTIHCCFSFTRSRYYKLTFSFLETSIHQAQPFINCPVQQYDPSIIYLPNPQIPMNFSQTTHITTNKAIKVTTQQHFLIPNNNNDLLHSIIKPLNSHNPPINQLATITLPPFSTLQLALKRNLKSFPIILAPCPFHFTSLKQQISK